MSAEESIYRGPLPARAVLATAWAMLRRHAGRVAIAAAIFFVPLTIVRHVIHDYFEDYTADTLSPALAFLVVFVALGAAAAVLGPVMYAGFLEAAVGAEHHGEGRQSLGHVVRTLPWLRLIWADLLVVAITGIGLSLLVVPGIIAATLLSLTGPLISMKGLHSIESMRYSARLVLPHFWKVLLLVRLPLALEHAIEDRLEHLVDEQPLLVDVGVTWIVAAVIYGFIGLMEVAIAYELVHRAERAEAADEPRAPRRPQAKRTQPA